VCDGGGHGAYQFTISRSLVELLRWEAFPRRHSFFLAVARIVATMMET
jgi:hypothetical protein